MMKKKSRKRFLSWLLAAVMIIALMPANAFAEPPTESSGNTETAVTSYCPSSEGGTDVSVGGYDSSPAAKTKDIPTEEPVKDTPTEEPAKDTPTEEPAKDTPTAEPAKDTPTAEPVKESPVADKTTEGAPAQEGAVENSTDEKITEDLKNEVSAAELAGMTGMLGAPVLLNLYADTSYHVYVYGYFVNGNTYLGRRDTTVNGDNTISGSYLYFGEKTTTVSPWSGSSQTVLNEVLPQLTESPLTKSGFSTENDIVAKSWEASSSLGHWNLYGNIRVYKINYDANGGQKNTLPDAGHKTYYYGTYTIPTTTPSASNNKVFAGWTVNGNTKADGTYYQGGDTITLKDYDADNTGIITLQAQWEDFPVYVYGCFKHKGANNTDENLGSDAALYVNSKQVNWNPDNAKGEYYITFGKLANATTVDPSDYSSDKDSAGISTNEIVKRINKGEVVLSNGTGSAKANGLLENPSDIPTLVHAWSGLKSRDGAASYAEETKDKRTWHLDGTIYLYKVTYERGTDESGNAIPEDEIVNLPKEKTYFLGNYTVRKMETSSQKYKFLGWMYDGKLLQEGAKIDAPGKDITLTAKWAPKEKVYTVNYEWDGSDGVPSNFVNQKPADGNSYGSEIEAKNAMDKTFTSTSTSNAQKDGKEGLWKFSGWTASDPVASATEDNTEVITFTGSWTFTEKVVKVTYDWGTSAPSDKTCPTGGSYNTEEAARNNMDTSFTNESTSNAPNGSIAGSWAFSGWVEKITTSPDGNTVLIALTGSWNFTPSETKTITDVLNGRVLKSFTAQYNRSTSGTFTATATVVAKSQQEAIPYAAKETVPTDSNTKTFTGKVTLSTGQTEPFVFKGEDVSLGAKTEYTITVAEEPSQQSYVTDDKTVYTITFTTDADGKINKEGITITPNNSEATTITFHNIYTYKKSSHSSGDSGNGGGKKEEKPTVEIKDDDALGLNNTDHFAYIVGYGNGEVRPQNSITRAEVAAIFFRLLEDDVRDANYTRQNKFTDVSNDAWYCSAVSTLSAMGIISGYPDATFRPNASITRAEFAAIATRFDVNGDKTPASFNDIAGHWAKDEIAVAANNGWVNGYEDGSFRPQNKITRAETMSLVNRVLNRKPETAEDLLENMTKWTDNADTNAWYYLAVQEATNSHYYEYKENSQYEKWTELRETRDWSELDK